MIQAHERRSILPIRTVAMASPPAYAATDLRRRRSDALAHTRCDGGAIGLSATTTSRAAFSASIARRSICMRSIAGRSICIGRTRLRCLLDQVEHVERTTGCTALMLPHLDQHAVDLRPDLAHAEVKPHMAQVQARRA